MDAFIFPALILNLACLYLLFTPFGALFPSLASSTIALKVSLPKSQLNYTSSVFLCVLSSYFLSLSLQFSHLFIVLTTDLYLFASSSASSYYSTPFSFMHTLTLVRVLRLHSLHNIINLTGMLNIAYVAITRTLCNIIRVPCLIFSVL